MLVTYVQEQESQCTQNMLRRIARRMSLSSSESRGVCSSKGNLRGKGNEAPLQPSNRFNQIKSQEKLNYVWDMISLTYHWAGFNSFEEVPLAPMFLCFPLCHLQCHKNITQHFNWWEVWLFNYFKTLLYLVISFLQLPNLVENWMPSKEGFEPVTVSPEIGVGTGRTAVPVLWVVFPWIALAKSHCAFSSCCSLPHSAVVTGDRPISVATLLLPVLFGDPTRMKPACTTWETPHPLALEESRFSSVNKH